MSQEFGEEAGSVLIDFVSRIVDLDRKRSYSEY
jgi:hypothetical protein